jgi:conjugative relaxase-like TrwC/TraI family protein
VLIIRGVGAAAVGYYLDGRARGEWIGAGIAALGLEGEVAAGELRAVLQGRHPGTGRFLPDRKPARRRAGWDLMFAAPKSVSLLARRADRGTKFASAHSAAVRSVLSYIEHRMLTCASASAPGGRGPALGAVAAAFDHRTNAASEPHIHTHLLLANLGQGPDGRWAAVSSSQWKVSRRTLEALYQLELRDQISQSGIGVEWRLRSDGFADIAAVPRAAVRAASKQSRATASRGWFAARSDARQTSWRESVAAEGFELDARGLVGPGALAETPRQETLGPAVTRWLATRQSEFSLGDVLTGLAARREVGLPAEAAHSWAEEFCEAAIPAAPVTSAVKGGAAVKGGVGPRWTSHLAKAEDDALLRLLSTLGDEGSVTTPRLHTFRSVTHLAAALAGEDRPAVVLGCDPGRSQLVAHAETLETYRRLLGEERDIVVDSPSPGGSLRWLVLAGIGVCRPQTRGSIVVVDQAGRRNTPDLLALVTRGLESGNRFVLVEGGTFPHLSRPRSRGLLDWTETQGRFSAAATLWGGSSGGADPGEVPARGRDAAERLLCDWAVENRVGDRPLLVGLGPEEVESLNQAARSAVGATGALVGPVLEVSGREFRAGDRVVVLRTGRLGLRGSLGDVVDARPPQREMTVRWDTGRTARLDAGGIVQLGHGYAATPALAAHSDLPVLALAPPDALPALRERVLLAAWSGGIADRDRTMGRYRELRTGRDLANARRLEGRGL